MTRLPMAAPSTCFPISKSRVGSSWLKNKTVTIAGQDAGPAPVITYAKDGSTATGLYVFEVGVEHGDSCRDVSDAGT